MLNDKETREAVALQNCEQVSAAGVSTDGTSLPCTKPDEKQTNTQDKCQLWRVNQGDLLSCPNNPSQLESLLIPVEKKEGSMYIALEGENAQSASQKNELKSIN